MGKRSLRRSRSWRDLSLFMKMGFSKDSSTPALPLKRASSLGRRRMENRTREETTRSRIWGDNIIISNVPDQKTKEKDLQRRTSTKKKAVPHSVVFTTTPPIKTASSSSRRPSTDPHTNQLPAFTFSTKTLENSPVTTSILPPVSKPGSSQSNAFSKSHTKSVSVSTNKSMASEMSIPMVLDFDLARHPARTTDSGGSKGGLDFGFTAEIVQQTPLTEEEKQNLINTISPMHVVAIPTSTSSPKSRRGSSTLKRFFSLRKSDRSVSPNRSTKHGRSESMKHTRQSSNTPSIVIPNFEASNARTIYTRPPQISSPTSRNRDMAPRLTVQIPDSTMDRASKIFQNIYSAHAAALEKGSHTHSRSRDETWGYPTPVSSPSTSSIARTVYEIPDTVETRISRFNREHRAAPVKPSVRGRGSVDMTPISRSQSPATRGSILLHNTAMSRSQSPARRNSILSNVAIRSTSPAKRNSRTLKSSTRLSAFPIPPMNRVPVVPASAVTVINLSDVESDSSQDWDENEEEEEWEIESVSSKGTRGRMTVKEPEWEMLTPISKRIVVERALVL